VVVKGSFSLFSLSYLLNIPEITGFPDLEDLGFFPPVSLTVYLPLLEPNATGSKGQYHRSLLVLEYRVRKGLRCFIFFFLPKEGREGGGTIQRLRCSSVFSSMNCRFMGSLRSTRNVEASLKKTDIAYHQNLAFLLGFGRYAISVFFKNASTLRVSSPLTVGL